MGKATELPTTYPTLLSELKERIRTARLKAALAVNQEMIMLYWTIGRDLLAKKQTEHWGTKMIERLSRDLRAAFPDNKGFSRTNLFYMQMFAEAYPDERLIHQAGGLIPWKHNCVILDKVRSREQREWYIRKTIEHGWGRNVLVHMIEAGLYEHQGKAITNFKRTLPKPDSDLAQYVPKDKYTFAFLDRSAEAHERKLELSLVENISRFILELGKGFAFVGNQYRVEVDGQEFFIDMLFYHLKLRCYVVFELKTTEFRPEYAGKMNFYLSVVDDMLRHQDDKKSIGIILCKVNSSLVVEYALRDMGKPMGVARYECHLPTSEELTARYHAALETAQQPDQEPVPKAKTRKPRK